MTQQPLPSSPDLGARLFLITTVCDRAVSFLSDFVDLDVIQPVIIRVWGFSPSCGRAHPVIKREEIIRRSEIEKCQIAIRSPPSTCNVCNLEVSNRLNGRSGFSGGAFGRGDISPVPRRRGTNVSIEQHP
jgi:hypothetical protein